jgi:hypothetical protein
MPIPDVPTVIIICTGKIQDGQDRAFQSRGGLVNYKTHSDLSWFRPLLEGNGPTSDNLVLKINMCYKG